MASLASAELILQGVALTSQLVAAAQASHANAVAIAKQNNITQAQIDAAIASFKSFGPGVAPDVTTLPPGV